MSTTVVVLLVLAGLSESAGRVLPLVARRHKLSIRLVIGLMLTGTVVEGTLFALWPLASWTIADWAQPFVAPNSVPPNGTTGSLWTPSLVAPLLLAAVLSFPLLGPLLHTLLLIVVGLGLAGPLTMVSGLDWWSAAVCIGVAGVGLAATVEVVRRLIARILAGARKPEAGV